MEDSGRNQTSDGSKRGTDAESPAQIPKRGWREIATRVKNKIREDNVSIISAGTAFFLLLGLVPGMAAIISIYGLIANPSDVQAQFASLSGAMPAEARRLLEDQMTRIASQRQGAGIAAFISIALALWGGAAAMKTLINALNIIYHEKEKRGFVQLTRVALGLTFTFVLMAALSIGVLVALPPLLQHAGLGAVGRMMAFTLRWPFLFAMVLVGLAVLYRYGPSREKPQWKWVSPGAVVATLIWVVASGGFSVYAQHFASYNKTYGSLGAVVVLMLWLYLSSFALLIGAEINAESEHQTGQDTTTGSPTPAGQRGAYMADRVAKAA